MDEVKQATLKGFDRMTEIERNGVMLKIEQDMQAITQSAIIGIGSEQEKTRFCSAYLLGLYRYDKATGHLARVITMEDKRNVPHKPGESRWDRYPAVEALVRIGKPAIPAMIKNLENTDDEHVRGLSARVIYGVEGPDLAGIVLAIATAKQSDPIKKERLVSAIPLLKAGEYKKPN